MTFLIVFGSVTTYWMTTQGHISSTSVQIWPLNRHYSWYQVLFRTGTAHELMFTQIVFICSVFPLNTTNTIKAEAVWVWWHAHGCWFQIEVCHHKLSDVIIVGLWLLCQQLGAPPVFDPLSHTPVLYHMGVRVRPPHNSTHKHLNLLEPHGVYCII